MATMEKDQAAPGEMAPEEIWFTAAWLREHHIIMWTLLLLGVILVYFSLPLGKFLGTQYGPGSGSYTFDPEVQRDNVVMLRWLGSMLFVAGLVERVLWHFSANRQS
ncbi:MAG: hypothetical protein M3347_12170 [Armatimonadota bacterium]|nr:hypothetical protein [Armatimonadota bacterium]